MGGRRSVGALLVAASLSSPALSSRWHCAWRAPRSASADWHSRVDLHSRAGSCRPSSPRYAAHRPHHVELLINVVRATSARPLLTRRSLSQDHEWVKMDGDIGTIGITNHAQEQLGDVVFVELPEIGLTIEKDDTMGAVESVKAASDIYAPVSGAQAAASPQG